ncbi:MAG: hypothetical protein D6742_18400 [Cyanobacteria bacterium J069]|nr:MAG: hypothetical protein D6742_18400 [Cyanobacteria bacterium J069]
MRWRRLARLNGSGGIGSGGIGSGGIGSGGTGSGGIGSCLIALLLDRLGRSRQLVSLLRRTKLSRVRRWVQGHAQLSQ